MYTVGLLLYSGTTEILVNDFKEVRNSESTGKTRLRFNGRHMTLHRPTGCTNMLVCSCDLDLDPITLIYEPKPKILKMYPNTKNKLSRSRLSEVRALQTDRHADESDRRHYHAGRIRE